MTIRVQTRHLDDLIDSYKKWYLPLLLGAYVFHSKSWQNNPDGVQALGCDADLEGRHGSESNLTAKVNAVKGYLKSVCVHEVIANNRSEEQAVADVCPPIFAAEKADKLSSDISETLSSRIATETIEKSKLDPTS